MKKKLKLDELSVQSFATSVDDQTQGHLAGLVAITPDCDTNNNPRCVSPLCMTVTDPCSEGAHCDSPITLPY